MRATPLILVTAIGWILLITSGLAVAAPHPEAVTPEQQAVRDALEQRIEEINARPDELELVMEEGRHRITLCKTCHGADGVSVKPGVPNLAGQNPLYIVDQFGRFSDGRRNHFMMSGLAKSFTTEDKIRLAIYFSRMPTATSGGGRLELTERGRQLFSSNCTRCHGNDGRGTEGYARLAGQRPDYLAKMLTEFRDRTGRRLSDTMSGVAMAFSDEDIQALATYIASLK